MTFWLERNHPKYRPGPQRNFPNNTYIQKLNPDKCTFGVHASKFLGFMISQR